MATPNSKMKKRFWGEWDPILNKKGAVLFVQAGAASTMKPWLGFCFLISFIFIVMHQSLEQMPKNIINRNKLQNKDEAGSITKDEKKELIKIIETATLENKNRNIILFKMGYWFSIIILVYLGYKIFFGN